MKPPTRSAKELAEIERANRKRFLALMGVNIRQLRDQKGMTQDQLAEKARISNKYVHDIEAGKKCISVWVLKKISRAMNVKIESILPNDANVPEQPLVYKDVQKV